MTKQKFDPSRYSVIEYLLLSFTPFSEVNMMRTGPARFFDQLEKVTRSKKQTLQSTLSRAKAEGYITGVELQHLRLTAKGNRKIRKFTAGANQIEQWDGSWRMVFFDIPEKHKKKRDYLTSNLKEIGFAMLQKSVWVYPYGVTDQLEEIVTELQLSQYVSYLIVKSISCPEDIYAKFPDLKK